MGKDQGIPSKRYRPYSGMLGRTADGEDTLVAVTHFKVGSS